jgi:HD-GYP domain-containing protein (c-di-GMP phosphodiesterase class II)
VEALPLPVVIASGWFVLACLTWGCVVLPALRSARRADLVIETAVAAEVGAALSAGRADHAPVLLHGSGYAGLVFDRTVELARTLVGVDRAWILVRGRRDPGAEILVAATGLDEDLIGRRLAPGSPPGVDVAGSAPIVLRGSVCGALYAGAGADARALSGGQLELLTEVAQLCGAALALHGQFSRAEETADRSVSRLQAALDEWDGDTAAHSEHVVGLALGVGRRLGLSPAELIELELGARLHDVGKLRVPGSVLRKPGPLTPEERALVERHAEWGSQMVARIPALQAVAAIVRHHHERFDGQGYPSGVSGDRAPLASRILGTCDAYSAMTRDRPYRRARSEADAIAELRANAGTQFDPDVVAALADAAGRRPARPARRRGSHRRRATAVAVGVVSLVLALPAAQAAAACENADARPGAASAAELEASSVCLINELRAERGLDALRQSRELASAGARHAADMVRRRYFSHTSLDGSSMSERILRTGYVPSGASWILGETLAWGSGALSTPRSRVEAWLESPPHRRIMLEPRFYEIGVGVAPGAPQQTRFSAAATYAAEFGAVQMPRLSRSRRVPRDSWRKPARRPARYSAARPR